MSHEIDFRRRLTAHRGRGSTHGDCGTSFRTAEGRSAVAKEPSAVVDRTSAEKKGASAGRDRGSARTKRTPAVSKRGPADAKRAGAGREGTSADVRGDRVCQDGTLEGSSGAGAAPKLSRRLFGPRAPASILYTHCEWIPWDNEFGPAPSEEPPGHGVRRRRRRFSGARFANGGGTAAEQGRCYVSPTPKRCLRHRSP